MQRLRGKIVCSMSGDQQGGWCECSSVDEESSREESGAGHGVAEKTILGHVGPCKQLSKAVGF